MVYELRFPGPSGRDQAATLRGQKSIGPCLRWTLCLLSILLAPCALRAQEPLPPPTGEVLLVIAGNISLPNVGDEAHLDQALLAALPRHRFVTDTPWSKDGAQEFEGVLLDGLLKAVGAGSQTFEALGFDDYKATFGNLDISKYPVIVADAKNGTPLTLRTFGPLRIMYPFDEFPELRSESNVAMGVWQLVRMDVH